MKKIVIGCDLDGVVAKHSLGGFWVKIRLVKEKLLKKARSKNYFAPKTFFEKIAWIIINYSRVPEKGGIKIIQEMKSKGITFYLITSRLNFNYPSTIRWLKKFNLFDLFAKKNINVKDENPIEFKLRNVIEEKVDCFIDDDLEVLKGLCQTKARLYWVVPGHKNGNENTNCDITVCSSFKDALIKINSDFSLNIL